MSKTIFALVIILIIACFALIFFSYTNKLSEEKETLSQNLARFFVENNQLRGPIQNMTCYGQIIIDQSKILENVQCMSLPPYSFMNAWHVVARGELELGEGNMSTTLDTGYAEEWHSSFAWINYKVSKHIWVKICYFSLLHIILSVRSLSLLDLLCCLLVFQFGFVLVVLLLLLFCLFGFICCSFACLFGTIISLISCAGRISVGARPNSS